MKTDKTVLKTRLVKVKALRKKGYTMARIGKSFGVSPTTIYSWMRSDTTRAIAKRSYAKRDAARR